MLTMPRMKSRLLRTTGTCLLSGLLAACISQSINVKVESDIPVPLVAAIPLDMGVYYDPALSGYTYTEDSTDRPDWKVDSGAAQVSMFEQVLTPMFRSVTQVRSPQGGEAAAVAGVITPQVEEMQFALPNETKTEIYEAWIKYKLQLRADGQLIAEWPVTGYGKTEDALLTQRDDGLSTAINLAMRDAGAKLAIGFEKVPEIRRWLAQRTHDCQRYADAC